MCIRKILVSNNFSVSFRFESNPFLEDDTVLVHAIRRRDGQNIKSEEVRDMSMPKKAALRYYSLLRMLGFSTPVSIYRS
jgi:hypothetical protein